MSQIQGPLAVVAGVVTRPRSNTKELEYLIAQRPASSRFGGGLWEFPGGKIDVGESPQQALEREILEEVGITIEANQVAEVISHVYRDPGQSLHILLMVVTAKFVSGTSQNLQVADHNWVVLEQMSQYKFAEADQLIVNWLKNQIGNPF